MRLSLILLLLVPPLLSIFSRSDYAAAEEVAPTRVSIDVQEVPLRSALRSLFSNAHVPFVLRGAIPAVRVSLHLNDVPLADALALLVRDATFSAPGLSIEQRGDQYTVKGGKQSPEKTAGAPAQQRAVGPDPLPRARPPATSSSKITAVLNNLPFRDVVKAVCIEAGFQCVVDRNVPEFDVTLHLAGVPGWNAMNLLVAAARQKAPTLYLAQLGEVYVLMLGDAPPRRPGSDATR